MGFNASVARVKISVGTMLLSLLAVGSSSAAPTDSPAEAGFSRPPQVVINAASYTVSPETGGPRTKFIATLRNEGLSTIEYGNYYSLAIRTDDGWRRVRQGLRCVFTGEAHTMPPGGSSSQRVGWVRSSCRHRALEPGSYRASKRITFSDVIPGTYRGRTVRAFFRVESE